MGIFLRQLYKQKPGMYGPPSQVQSSIFKNAERAGIDPGKVCSISAHWGPGKQIDYAQQSLLFTNNNAVFQNNALKFNGASSWLSKIQPSPTIPFSVISVFTPISTLYAGLIGYFNSGSTGDWYNISTFTDDKLLIYKRSLNASGGFAQTTNSLLYGKENVGIGVFHGATLAEGFLNGNIGGKASETGGQTPSGNINNLTMGRYGDSSPSAYFNNLISLSAVINCALTDSQIAHLSDNPYFLLHRQAPVFYSVPSGAITLRQFGFRFFQDNAAPGSATVLGDQNESISLMPGSKFRIRMGIVKE